MYSRFEALEKYDLDQLENATAAVIGLGATGSVIAEHLAKHGVKLILIDRDYLEMNDLYSSNLYSNNQCERSLPKAKAAEEKLKDLTDIQAYIKNLDAESIDLLANADIVLDGTDNLETRLLIDDYCSRKGIPWVYTAALGERGFSMFVQDECFRCTFEKLNPSSSCQQNGVMREISSIAAAKSSMKAIKYLSGLEVEEKLDMIPSGKSFQFEACKCDSTESIEVSSVCGDGKYQVFGDKRPEEFGGEVLKSNEYLRRIEFEGSELTVFDSGRAIVHAPNREAAENVYREASSI
jgi:adenylyltransferase/sulfurtransferase